MRPLTLPLAVYTADVVNALRRQLGLFHERYHRDPVEPEKLAALRGEGLSFAAIAKRVGGSRKTVKRAIWSPRAART